MTQTLHSFKLALLGTALLASILTARIEAADFVRGDANADAAIDISDAIATLGYLFLGANDLPCVAAADANDDGAADISDAVSILQHLFLDGVPLPAPFPDCGPDPTLVPELACSDFPPCGGPPSIVVGSASAEVMIPMNGCLPAAVAFTTETGVRLSFAAGTCLTTRSGTRITGRVKLGIDDGNGIPLPVGTRPVAATLRIYVLLLSPGGTLLTDAHFEPPASVELQLGGGGLDGGWELTTPSSPDGLVLGPHPDGPAGGGPLLETGEIFLGNAALTADVAEILEILTVSGAQVLRLRFEPVEAMPSGGGAGGGADIQIHEVEIPAGPPDEVCAIRVIAPDSHQILTCSVNVAGASEERIIAGSSPWLGTYAYTIVSRGGKRFFQFHTHAKNVLTFYLELWSPGQPVVPLGNRPSTGGSPGEADLDGPYSGCIEVTVHGWGSFSDVHNEIVPLIVAASGVQRWDVISRRFERSDAGFIARVSVYKYSQSVRSLAAKLPASWLFTFGNRTLKIEIPCGQPVAVVSSYSARSLQILDPVELVVDPEAPPVILQGSPYEGALAGDGYHIFVASPDRLEFVDLETRSVRPLPVPGLTSGIDLDPSGEVLYAATSRGEFLAIDAADTSLRWRLEGLPQRPATALDVTEDGAFAYAAFPPQNVAVVDLLRRRAMGSLAADAQSLRASNNGLRLAIVHPPSGMVRVFDLLAGVMGNPIATGTGAGSPVWTPDDGRLLVANYGQNTVSVVNPATGSVVNLQTAKEPICIAAYREEGGQQFALVSTFTGGKVERIRLDGAPQVIGGKPAPQQPNLVRLSRR